MPQDFLAKKMSKKLLKLTKNKLEKLLKNTGDMALKRRARMIVEELDIHNGDRIIDVGCGDGYYLYILSNLGMRLSLTGIDFDRRALESAKKNLKDKKIKLDYGNLMERLPFSDSTFDKAVMSEVVEHLPNDVKGLTEVRRILKKDGILILTVPNARYPFLWDPVNWLLERLLNTHIKSGFWAGIWNQHIRLYKPRQIQRVVSKAGFRVSKVESLTFWCLPFNHYLLNFGARILAKDKSNNLTKGANKFLISGKRNPITGLFFTLSGLVDSLNDFYMPKSFGVSIFLKSKK